MTDPVETKIKAGRRLVLVLGKYRVLERHDQVMKLALGGSTTMTIVLPPFADVKAGDLLTLYTEVLYASPQVPQETNSH